MYSAGSPPAISSHLQSPIQRKHGCMERIIPSQCFGGDFSIWLTIQMDECTCASMIHNQLLRFSLRPFPTVHKNWFPFTSHSVYTYFGHFWLRLALFLLSASLPHHLCLYLHNGLSKGEKTTTVFEVHP